MTDDIMVSWKSKNSYPSKIKWASLLKKSKDANIEPRQRRRQHSNVPEGLHSVFTLGHAHVIRVRKENVNEGEHNLADICYQSWGGGLYVIHTYWWGRLRLIYYDIATCIIAMGNKKQGFIWPKPSTPSRLSDILNYSVIIIHSQILCVCVCGSYTD